MQRTPHLPHKLDQVVVHGEVYNVWSLLEARNRVKLFEDH